MVLNWCIRQFAETEIAMNAVERVNHYAHQIPVEADAINPNNRPPSAWPSTGIIKFENVSMSYAPELPLVLKSVSFEIQSKHKIGIVGRTGSGKSSLMQALFRMVEMKDGQVLIDGVRIREIGLRDLRQGLAIIPQVSLIF
jgi:ATP-binding cassette, subfamily C (CFTR/MRP), member 1